MAELYTPQRRLLLKLRFDGTDYCGWQVQPNGITVQEALQNAIEAVTGVRSGVIGCSRTDSGVHAEMFCCTFDTLSKIDEDKFIKALNAKLPADIAVWSCEGVSREFHPRYAATEKEYKYYILNSPTRNPFIARYSYQVFAPLDVGRMASAAACFVGKHDFSAFCAAGGSVEDKRRTVTLSTVECDFERVVFTVRADGFLYNMVRIMTGTLIETGLGKISPNDIPSIINSKNRELAGATAPPHGLFLNKVIY